MNLIKTNFEIIKLVNTVIYDIKLFLISELRS